MAQEALIASSLALALGGCSIVRTKHPQPPPAEPSCPTSRTPLAIDAGVALLLIFTAAGIGIAELIAEDKGDGFLDSEEAELAVGLTPVFALGVGLTSGLIGHRRIRACERAYAERRDPPYRLAPPRPIEPPPGTERGWCRPDATCDPGLVCASNRCVVPPR